MHERFTRKRCDYTHRSTSPRCGASPSHVAMCRDSPLPYFDFFLCTEHACLYVLHTVVPIEEYEVKYIEAMLTDK